MPRITLLNLPVEVHFEILKYALLLSQEAYYDNPYISLDDQLKKPDGWQWIEKDRANLSQFPYNAASVCRLWHAILAKIPECWTRVIIDVAFNPTKFLEVFLWSKDLPNLEVTIFSSHTTLDSPSVHHRELERRRVSDIFDALRPHVSRCKSITFDIIFLTSLPSPVIFLLEDAPFLEELILECKLNNGHPPERFTRFCDIGVQQPISTFASFPKLKHLSITGFWFMFIAGHPHTQKLFGAISGERGRLRRCFISHFKFQNEGQYTLQNFISYCSELHGANLTVQNFSLNYDIPGSLACPRYVSDEDAFTPRDSLTFKNVTADVLQSLFSLTDISPISLAFDNCTFPDKTLFTSATELSLQNIPHSSTAYSADKRNTANLSANLSSILQGFSGYSLHVTSCPSFDDSVISALHGYMIPDLHFLRLSDCGNVTVLGVQKFLERRNQCSAISSHDLAALGRLSINGNCPFPSEEDQKWFQTSVYAKWTSIDWRCRDPENLAEIQTFSKGLGVSMEP